MVPPPQEAHSPATEDATQDAPASAEDDLEAADQAVMLEGLPQVIADALKRLPEDVGALLETPVVEALAELKAGDLAGYVRVRHMAKGLNKGVLLGLLDKAVQAQLPHGDADPSAIDELVGLARETGRFVHDADRKAYAILPVLGHTEVWPVMSSGFEEWLRALYWRHCERGVPETTLKSALATLAAAGLNDGDEVEVHWRAAQHGEGYLIDLCDEHWRAVEVGAWGWRVLTPSPAYFTRTAAMRALPEPDTAHADLGLLWRYTPVRLSSVGASSTTPSARTARSDTSHLLSTPLQPKRRLPYGQAPRKKRLRYLYPRTLSRRGTKNGSRSSPVAMACPRDANLHLCACCLKSANWRICGQGRIRPAVGKGANLRNCSISVVPVITCRPR